MPRHGSRPCHGAVPAGRNSRATADHKGATPLFGLPDSFTRLRLLGDGERFFEGGGRGATPVLVGESYGLFHGDPLSSGEPYLQMITSRNTVPELLGLLKAEELRPGSGVDADEPQPFEASVLLDGESVLFEGIRGRDCWVLQAPRDGHSVSVVGVRYPLRGLALTRISNVEPYISGRREYLRTKHPEAGW